MCDRIPHCEERAPVIPTCMKLIVNIWKPDTGRWCIELLVFSPPPLYLSRKSHSWRSNLGLDTTCPCCGCYAVFYCCTDGPAAGVPGDVTGPVTGCQHRACESLSHNYLAMQHIIQSSGIQTSAQSGHPSERFLPSQQILVVVGSQGKGLSGSVSASGVCVYVCVCV